MNTNFIINLFRIQNQIKIFHWQTKSYPEHKALDDFYSKYLSFMDKFVEVYSGKYDNLFLEKQNIVIENYNKEYMHKFIDSMFNYIKNDLIVFLDDTDTDLLNIIEEILADINQLKYLLRLT